MAKHRTMNDNPLAQLEAHRLVQKMRGGAQAHLIETTDGSWYVVKFANNPQHPRVVINEWLASSILRQLGIATPETAVVNISADFIRDNPEVYIGHTSRHVLPTCGSHFGSRFPKGPMAVYDFIPDAILGRVANLFDFSGVLVVDKWLGNTDHRQAIFFKPHGIHSRFVAQMIDNGSVFDGYSWHFRDSPIIGPYFGRVYQRVQGIESFEPWLRQVAIFPEATLREAFHQTPMSWREGDIETAFERLLHQLMRRRESVRDLIYACRAQPANPFPNWV
jgi:hypothetical protein